MARPAEHLSPVLQHGFRPFFLLGALWAASGFGPVARGRFAGALALPSASGRCVARHEMLFGYLPRPSPGSC